MMAQKPSATINADMPLAQAILDTIREPLLVLDEELRVLTASRAFCRLFNAGRPVAEGCAFHALGEGQWDIPELTRRLHAVLPTHTAFEKYETEQPAGSMGRRQMLLNAREVFHEHECKAHILLSMEDVTERRAVERKLAEILQQKETLLAEMQHRVANSLQIIASILLLKARTVQSDETRGHLHDAHRRVMSVASTQAHLRASGQGESIAMGPYLRQLCDALASSMVSEQRAVQFKVQVERGDAASAEAVSLGLIVTELVINAFKHAFTDDTVGGLIVVSYDVDGTAWRLTVCDNGVGKPEGESQQKATGGLGTSIVAALAQQIDGRVELSSTSPRGTTVSIVHGSMSSRLSKAA